MKSSALTYLININSEETSKLLCDDKIQDSKPVRAVSRALRLSERTVWIGLSTEATGWLRLNSFLVVRSLAQGAYLRWNAKIMRLVSLKQKLLTTSAYVSTLGGGYFLCKFVNQAKIMAARQFTLAKCLNDTPLEIQCCIHMAYSLIREGKWNMASSIIKYQEARCALLNSNHEIISVVKSAKRFLRKIKKTSTKLKKIKILESTATGHILNSHRSLKVEQITSAVTDDFQRHHIIESIL